jgi:isopentenyl diphosphate isomerase/L-lactate dehydrogenase-like FMN-dependent dehydrogenase
MMSRFKRKIVSPETVSVEDIRRLARQRVPKVVFDYIDGGADAEVTLRENSRAFEEVTFWPHQAISLNKCDLRTNVLGSEISFPVLLAPVGYSRLMFPKGEIAAARAAASAGVGYVLSTISGCSLESVKEAIRGPAWYQLYLIGGRDAAVRAIERARTAGYTALVITVDTAVAGKRERDSRNGMKQLMSGSVLSKLPHIPQLLSRPGWLLSFLLDGGVPDLENVKLRDDIPMKLLEVGAALEQAVVSWSDLHWIRKSWTGPIVIKGILTPDDAGRALDEGAAAVVVSNHGGRQLDCVSPSLRALPSIARAVGGRIEVFMDGGVKRGTDVVKALCMGARAVLIGKAYAYGLAAAGSVGVGRVLEILRSDVERTMRLLGCSSLAELQSSFVTYPSEWE